MRNILLGATLVAGASLLSCEREIDLSVQTAEDNATAEMAYSQMGPTIQYIGIEEEGPAKTQSLFICADVSVEADSSSENNYPKTFTLDYGTGCVGPDGRTRSGIMKLTYAEPWNADESNVVLELEDYHIDGVLHEGTITAKRSKNDAGNRELETNLTGGKIHMSDGTIYYESSRTFEWLEGGNTILVEDDYIKMYGSSNGTDREGDTFVSVIVTPLERRMSCDYISKGITDVTPEGKETRTIDFGDGTCDDKATLSVRNSEFEFTLR